MNYKRLLLLLAMLTVTAASSMWARVYTWDRFDIAFEGPDDGFVPFVFFQDPNSAQVEWEDMLMTLQHYVKNENTTKDNINETLKSRALGFNMYDTKLFTIKVKGFKCYSLEGTMPDGSRCIISYLVSDKTTTVLEVIVNYLLGNREVVEDMIKSFSENNNQKPNEREKPKQKVQDKKDAERQEEELRKARELENAVEC